MNGGHETSSMIKGDVKHMQGLLNRNWIPAAGTRNSSQQPIYAGVQTLLCTLE
jgi:hypothetical protein